MSSPKEPGHAAPGDGSGSGSGSGNGNGPGNGPSSGSGNGYTADRSGGQSRPASAAQRADQGPPTARITDGPLSGEGPRSGEASRSGEAPRSDEGGVPPWQRGAARPQQSGPRPPAEAPQQQRAAAPDNRPARYLAGTAVQPAADDADPARSKEYASELPDLSGPRGQQPRKPAGEQSSTQRSGGGAPRVQVASRSKAGPVRASMQIRRIDPWSALKVSLLLSIAMFFVWMITVAVLYLVLGGMGVWTKLNSNVGDLLTSTSGSSGELVSSGTIFGGALLIGLLNIVLLTALATVGAFIYNLTTDIVGGVEVTLADRD